MLVAIALKSSLVLAIAWLISLALRRASAAVRHLVWTGAFMAILALPFFSLSLPSLRIHSPGVAALFEISAIAQVDGVALHALDRSDQPRLEYPAHGPFNWRLLLLALWAAGIAAGLTQMLIAYRVMSRLRSRATPSPDCQLANQLAAQLGVSTTVNVIEASDGSIPMTWGILRPVILMPGHASAWSEDQRRMVLLHELAHVRRGDLLTHLAARLALLLHWWNPLAWIAWREFVKERERATDDLVLEQGARASDYAAHLLDVARSVQPPSTFAWAAVAMARRSQLEGRLIRILDARVNRKAAGRASVLFATLLAIAMVAPFAAVRAQDRQTNQSAADIDATIRKALAQIDYVTLEKMAATYESLGHYDDARKLLDADRDLRARNAGTESPEYGAVLIKLADLEAKRNQPAQAQELYTQGLRLLGDRPEAADALIHLGIADIMNKNYPQAMEYFQRAQKANSNQAGAVEMWMAIDSERENNLAEAETHYKSALAVEGADSSDAATIMELYARLLKDQGRLEEAKSQSDRAFEIRRALGAQQPVSDAPHIGNGITSPKPISRREPEYTDEARAAKYQGTVVLSVDIDQHGVPQNIQVTRGLGLGLDQNAIAAVSQWRFQPATKDGAPVTVQAKVEVNFRLL